MPVKAAVSIWAIGNLLVFFSLKYTEGYKISNTEERWLR